MGQWTIGQSEILSPEYGLQKFFTTWGGNFIIQQFRNGLIKGQLDRLENVPGQTVYAGSTEEIAIDPAEYSGDNRIGTGRMGGIR